MPIVNATPARAITIVRVVTIGPMFERGTGSRGSPRCGDPQTYDSGVPVTTGAFTPFALSAQF